MKRFANWKTAFIALIVFVFTTVLLPAFTTQAFAADTPTQVAQAGAAGGAATSAGVSAGTIVTVLVVASTALAVALSASSGDGTTTSHH